MKGTYILKVKVKETMDLKVGALGICHFKSGTYLYVGSAMNSLENRIKRHLCKDKRKKHWHIDYLTSAQGVEVEGVYIFLNKRMEEEISKKLAEICTPVKGFGASDMKNVSSNLYFSSRNTEKLIHSLGGVKFEKILPGHA